MYDVYHRYFSAIVLITFFTFTGFFVHYLFRNRLRWQLHSLLQRPIPLCGSLAASSVLLFWFVVHFGDRQFGGYDFSAVTDTGWRLVNGQRPYRDFICTLPPAFALGVSYAFSLWGSFWQSQLYFTALFTCLTFLWLFFLLDAVLQVRAVAFFTAITVECLSNLLTSFWWYNTTASVAAGIFLLSCIAYLARPRVISYQISYVASLFLLALMKPNYAAPLMAGLLLILLSEKHYIRTIALTVGAFAVVIGFLALNHMPVHLVLQSYRAAARSRGLSLYGIRIDSPTTRLVTAIFLVWLLTPLLLWPACVRSFLLQRRYFSLRVYLMLALGPIVGVLAMLTNGENKFVDMVPILIPGVILLFGKPDFGVEPLPAYPFLRTFEMALLTILALIGLYTGVTRFRVMTIGPFFQLPADRYTDNEFLGNLRTGTQMVRLMQQVRGALNAPAKEPIFFGPRMEFEYAAFRLPSPKYLPIWWQPGTSFAKSEEDKVLLEWQNRRFGTLIFYKNDFLYYGPEFLSLLERMYQRDDSYSEITVLRLR